MQLVLRLSPGGTERLVIEICRKLADRVDSMVVCLDDRGAWADELESAGIQVVALRRASGFRPALSRQIARLIHDHDIDVLHCHHYSPYVYGLLASVMTNTRLVFTEHGRLSDDEPSLKRRLVNPFLSMLGGSVCAVSGDLKAHMAAEGFPRRRIRVIYNGIEPGHRPTGIERTVARDLLGLARDAFVTGTVGRLDPVKNLGALLDAHRLLLEQQPAAHLVIIGDGPERAALEQAAGALGIARAVTFAGYRSDVRALMPAFDAYANTSAYEGASLTILEAMAAGLPVVATRVGGNPEVVIDQETGFLVPSEPLRIAEALSSLARSRRRRRSMGDAGRWRVMRYFSIARMVNDYANLYFDLASTATSSEPASVPTTADPISVSDPTRSTV